MFRPLSKPIAANPYLFSKFPDMKNLYTLGWMLLCCPFVFGQWANIYDNQKVAYLDGQVQRQSVILDDEGGCFVIWQDAHDKVNIDQIYAQHFDSLGTPSRAVDGIPLSPTTKLQNHMVALADGQGGAFIIWRDLRDTTNSPTSTGPDIWGQRIDKTGLLWGNGKALIMQPGEQGAPLIVSDEAGGFIFSFEDGGDFQASRSAGYWMQRCDASGNAQWSSGGELVHKQSSTFSASIDLALAPDGQNGAILVYNEAAFNQTTGTNIYGHRMNQSGSRLWTPDADTIAGVVIERGYPICKEPGPQTNPQILTDENGDMTVCWQDRRNSSWQYGALFAQSLAADGSYRWNATGVQISPAGMGATNRFGMVADLHGGVYFEYCTTGHEDHDLIRYKLDGTKDWSNPINISDNMTLNSPLQATSTGGVAVAWLATGINQPGSEDGILAQIFDSTGAVLQTGGVLMSSYPEDKGPVALAVGTKDELFGAWIDFRRTNGQASANADPDLFAQRLTPNSINLAEVSPAEAFDFDLIAGKDKVAIIFTEPLSEYTPIKLYDLHGRLTAQTDGEKGVTEVTIDLHHLSTGIYIIAIENPARYATRRFFHR